MLLSRHGHDLSVRETRPNSSVPHPPSAFRGKKFRGLSRNSAAPWPAPAGRCPAARSPVAGAACTGRTPPAGPCRTRAGLCTGAGGRRVRDCPAGQRSKSADRARGRLLVRRAATGRGSRGPAAHRRRRGRECPARPPLAQCGCARFLPCGPEASRRGFRGQRRDFPCAASSAVGAVGPIGADFSANVGIFHGQRARIRAVGGIPQLCHQRVFARHPWIALYRRMGLSCPDRRPSRSRGWKPSAGGRRTGSPWLESVPRGIESSLRGTEAGFPSWLAPKPLASAARVLQQPRPSRPPG